MTTSRTEVLVRPAQRADIGRIVELAAQLGYSLKPSRVGSTIDDPGDRTLLVGTDGKLVVGWIALARDTTLLGEGDAWIEGLIVAETHRERGIGSTLLACGHAWGRK